MADDARDPALERLDAFIGTWHLDAVFPHAPPSEGGDHDEVASATFEWTLDGRFLVQRTNAPRPAPDSLAVVNFDPAHHTYTQHYFDSRGVVRLYAMTFDGRAWTLERTSADFTPLDFEQRFTSEFSDDGATIRGRWEKRPPGASTWEHDFDLSYVRAGDR
jgi:hypothetical protein